MGLPRKGARHGKAVVCGGGIAGVLSARVCLTHFEEVILVDPEFSRTLNGTPKTRIMQYNSIHVYLILFAEGLRQLWRNFDELANEAGAVPYTGDWGVHIDGSYLPTITETSPPSFGMRRSALEPFLHKLLANDTPDAKNRLIIIDGSIRGVQLAPSGDRISVMKGKRNDGADFEIEGIDLIMDCTGRAQSGTK